MFGWAEGFGKFFRSKLLVSRESYKSVEVDISGRFLRIDAEVVVPTCPIFATLAYGK